EERMKWRRARTAEPARIVPLETGAAISAPLPRWTKEKRTRSAVSVPAGKNGRDQASGFREFVGAFSSQTAEHGVGERRGGQKTGGKEKRPVAHRAEGEGSDEAPAHEAGDDDQKQPDAPPVRAQPHQRVPQ